MSKHAGNLNKYSIYNQFCKATKPDHRMSFGSTPSSTRKLCAADQIVWGVVWTMALRKLTISTRQMSLGIESEAQYCRPNYPEWNHEISILSASLPRKKIPLPSVSCIRSSTLARTHSGCVQWLGRNSYAYVNLWALFRACLLAQWETNRS